MFYRLRLCDTACMRQNARFAGSRAHAAACGRARFGSRGLTRLGCLVLLLASAAGHPTHASAQDAEQTPPSDTPYKLHVYEDLVQVPTLVLNSSHGSYGGLTAAQFTLRIDAGPPFQPRHVRLEGEDPIAMAFLLDVTSTDSARLLENFDSELNKLPPDVFHPNDRISVFAYACHLVHASIDVPASFPALRTAVAAALRSPDLRGKNGTQSNCGAVRLWDAIAGVATRVGSLPGRRVLFIVSDGFDSGSSNTWNTVRSYADNVGLTLIGVRPALLTIHLARTTVAPPPYVLHIMEEPFEMLCAGTGGLTLESETGDLGSTLVHVNDLLRHRYIVEFPRPSNGTAGVHQLVINIPDKRAIVRASGITFPIQDKGVLNDPSTVPSDPARAPVEGDRKILTQPH